MIRTTRWYPDTCGCCIDYEWDDALDENTRVHIFKALVSRCPEHATWSGKDVFDQVVSENSRKNFTFDIIQKAAPTLQLENYLWWFDKDRNLSINLVGINIDQATRDKVKKACDEKFGARKVKVL